MAELPIAIQCGRGAPAAPPLDSGFRRSDELGGYPGSWSGTCFRTNRSCRLVPAHQGMKRRSCGLVQRIGAADSATPHPDPSGGQAPALHSPLPTPLDSGLRGNDEWKGSLAHSKAVKAHFRTNRSCRLAPAHQGMKSWSCGLVRRIGTPDSATPPIRPSGGQAPALHSPLPTPLDSRLRGNDGACPAFREARICVPMTLTRLVPLSLNSYEAHW